MINQKQINTKYSLVNSMAYLRIGKHVLHLYKIKTRPVTGTV